MTTNKVLVKENQQLKRQSAALKGQVTRARNDVQKRVEQIADLEQKATVDTSAIDNLRIAEKNLAAMKAERDSAVAQAKQAVGDNLVQIEKLHNDNAVLNQSVSDLEAENERLQSDVATARSDALRAQQATREATMNAGFQWPWWTKKALVGIGCFLALMAALAFFKADAPEQGITIAPGETVELEPIKLPELVVDAQDELDELTELDALDALPDNTVSDEVLEAILPPAYEQRELEPLPTKPNNDESSGATVKLQWSNLRSTPDSNHNSNIMDTLDKGEPIELLEEKDGWFKVAYTQGSKLKIGYMHHSTVSAN